jgi:heme O synthase-like polyprenyltransferase
MFSRKSQAMSISEVAIRWLPDALFIGGATMLAKLYSDASMTAALGNTRNMPILRGLAERPESWEFALVAFVTALGLDLVLRRAAIWR